ncbi:hypothetical protein WFP10_17480 [Yersinia enterocolitica]
MSEIKQLKRFIYSATVTSGSGSQSFYIDAKNREEADKRAANNESDGMYADDSEVTDLDALEYEDETTVDDFGDFPLISREQSLIAQLEAAQGNIKELESKVNHYVAAEYAHKHFDQTPDIIKRADSAELELVKVKAELLAAQKELGDLHNQEFQQRLANAEHQLYMKDLAIHNIKASRKAQFRKRLAAEAALSAANEPWRSFVTNDDISALNRFAECCDDPESGGHDLDKDQVERLVSIGALRKTKRNYHETTDFGDFVISAGFTVEGNADAE